MFHRIDLNGDDALRSIHFCLSGWSFLILRSDGKCLLSQSTQMLCWASPSYRDAEREMCSRARLVCDVLCEDPLKARLPRSRHRDTHRRIEPMTRSTWAFARASAVRSHHLVHSSRRWRLSRLQSPSPNRQANTRISFSRNDSQQPNCLSQR